MTIGIDEQENKPTIDDLIRYQKTLLENYQANPVVTLIAQEILATLRRMKAIEDAARELPEDMTDKTMDEIKPVAVKIFNQYGGSTWEDLPPDTAGEHELLMSDRHVLLYDSAALAAARKEGEIAVMREAIDAGSVFVTWWAMVNARRELDGDPPLKDGDVILHYSGCGASCTVTAGQINRLCRAIQEKAK